MEVLIHIESFFLGVITGIIIAFFSKIVEEWRKLKKRLESDKK